MTTPSEFVGKGIRLVADPRISITLSSGFRLISGIDRPHSVCLKDGGLILDIKKLKALNFSGVAITAAIQPDGTLDRVGGEFEKLLAAAREKSLPRIHTVIVAEAQREDIKRIDPDLLKDDPHAAFRVICAPSFAEAVRLLQVDAETRWGEIKDCSIELDRHRDFVGRAWLKKRVRAFIDSDDHGYLILTGGPGVGKSAFVAEQVRQSQHTIFDFIMRGMGDWDEPATILGSLTAQLRRMYALPKTDAERQMSASADFFSVLQRVSRTLTDGQKMIIYLDGLDEAFGPTGRFAQVALPDVLPRMLPEGIKMILTSRPGDHLDWLADRTVYPCQSLEPDAQDNRDDIRVYLRQQNRARNLGLDDDFIEHLVDASEGYFIAAERYLHPRESLHDDLQKWQQDASQIPEGFEGWIAEQWKRLIDPLPPEDPNHLARWSPPPPRNLIKAILGLMATAHEPLSYNHLTAFLKPAIGHTKAAMDALSIGFLTVAELHRHLDEVLRLSQEFFDPLDTTQGVSAPYRFFHTLFIEFIMTKKLSDVEKLDCHHLLAQAGAGWQRFQGAVRDYALRHRLAHLIAAQEWEGVAQVFAEADFIVERSERFDFASVHADALTAAEHPNLPHDWKEAFREWERFLRWRVERLRHFPRAYPQEVFNEFLPTASKLLGNALTPLRDGFSFASPFSLRKTFGPPALSGIGHEAPVSSVAISLDGQFIASGSSDRTVKVWGLRTGQLVADCIGHQGAVTSVAFSPDNRFIASGSWDGTVKVWDAQTGQLVANWIAHNNVAWSVVFSPDGRSVVSGGGGDARIKVWDAQTGRLMADHVGHVETGTSVAFSPDGRLVAFGDDGRTVKVWEAETGIGYEGVVPSVVIASNGRLVASGSEDGRVKVWDAETGWTNDIGHQNAVKSVAISSDGQFVASGSGDGTVKMWNAQTRQLVADYVGHESGVRSVAISHDGQLIASGGDDQAVKVWDVQTRKFVAECIGHDYVATSVALSPNGQFVVSGGNDDGKLKVWDAQTGQISCERLVVDYVGDEGSMRHVAISSDGRLIASGSDDKTVKVWDVQTRKLVAECIGHDYVATSVAFSPNGRFVVSGGNDDGTLKVWDTQTGKLVAKCIEHDGRLPEEPRELVFSPDGQFVASVGKYFGNVRVFEAETGRLVTCLTWLEHTVAISSDGQRMVSSGHEGTVKVWETQSGQRVVDYVGHEGPVCSVAISPDGRFVVSGDWDGTVKVWDTQANECVNTLFFDRAVISVAFLDVHPLRLVVADISGRVFGYEVIEARQHDRT